MNFLTNKRGQIRVIEAFFAAVLMLSSLALIPAVQKVTSDSNSVLASTAFNVLASLDSNGHLASLVDAGNWSAIGSCVEALVPPAVWFNVTVFGEDMAPLNSVPICNGGAIGNHIEAADYLCVSVSGDYAIYTVRLQLGGLN